MGSCIMKKMGGKDETGKDRASKVAKMKKETVGSLRKGRVR